MPPAHRPCSRDSFPTPDDVSSFIGGEARMRTATAVHQLGRIGLLGLSISRHREGSVLAN
jgi:hypothetical protein